MPSPSATGATLAAIKEQTGLSWSALADVIGASSGDYVRKVASGAKPGNNLASNVAELMRTGEVSRPAPRRVAASGQRARVRASASTGAPSRRPAENVVRPPDQRRRMFRKGDGRMGWTQATGDASSSGADAFRAAVRSAGRGRHRVKLYVRVRDGRGGTKRVEIGERGGYRARDILDGLRSNGGDLAQYLASQTAGRSYAGAVNASSIVDVEVVTL